MTREKAKEFMWLENNKNPSVIKWQHHKTIGDLVEKLIDQIFNDHEAQLKLASDVYSTDKMHMYQELKAKDEITQDIKEAYALKSIAYDLLLEAIKLKDEEIERLKIELDNM